MSNDAQISEYVASKSSQWIHCLNIVVLIQAVCETTYDRELSQEKKYQCEGNEPCT